MSLKDAFNNFLGEDDPPKFTDLSSEQIYELIDFFEQKKKKISEEMSTTLWQIEREEEDCIKNKQLEYKQRKSRLIEKAKEEIRKLQPLLNALYIRVGPRKKD